jgi:DNA-binding GntR family transcriptional regulator
MKAATLQEKAHGEILDQILKGRIQPGERLREQHVAEKLNMSATPVREAFRRLEREGWVESQPQCGVQLRTFSAEDIEDIYAIREGLEIAAIDLGIVRATEADWRRIKQTADIYTKECERLFDAVDSDVKLPGPGMSDTDFHLSLIAATHSRKYCQLAEIVYRQILYAAIHVGTSFRLDYQEMMRTSYEHMSIYNALRSGEVRLAEEILRSHLRIGKDRVISQTKSG